jgi:hypothetical protein
MARISSASFQRQFNCVPSIATLLWSDADLSSSLCPPPIGLPAFSDFDPASATVPPDSSPPDSG